MSSTERARGAAAFLLLISAGIGCTQREDPSLPTFRPGAVVIPALTPPPPRAPAPGEDTEEPGLEFRLRAAPGQGVMGVPSAPPTVPATTLPEPLVTALLARLPALPAEARDTFRFPPASPPPPRAGAIVHATFPPPDAVAPSRPEPPSSEPPLEVVRVTPTGAATTIVPELVITFSRPMVPITTVGALDAAQVPVRLVPQPAGRWSWVDTRTLRFEPAGRLPMATRYALEVPAGTRSADGGALAEARRVEFETPPLRAIGAYPNRGRAEQPELRPMPVGGPREPWFHPGDPAQAVTDLDPLVFLLFDQRVDPAAVLPSLELIAEGRVRRLRIAGAAEIAGDSAVQRLVDAAEEGHWMVVRPSESLPRGAAVQVSVLPGARSAEGPLATRVPQELHFRTYGRLAVVETSCAGARDAICLPRSPWSISFTNPLDTAAWSDAYVRVEPEVPQLTVTVSGGRLVLAGDTRPRTRYRVTLDPRIRDRFGQNLGSTEPLTFEVGDAQPFLTLQGAPFIVLDPEGPPRVLVHSRGQESLRIRLHRVRAEDWPAYQEAVRRAQEGRGTTPFAPPGELVLSTTIIPPGEVGDFSEVPVDVSPALADGLGHAVLSVEGGDGTGASRSGPMERWPTYAWVQSTRIGLSLMIDEAEVRAWTTSLLDGAPLPGVELQLLPSSSRSVTGGDGVGAVPLLATASNVLVARLGSDTALLPENPHGWWSPDGWQRRASAGELRWLLFTDRGLYRPGERVHLKGWMRRAEASAGGEPRLPAGVGEVSYSVSGPRQEELTSGSTPPTLLGGFHTTFELPAESNLGGAQIRLQAIGTDVPEQGREAWHHVQVQEFRRPEYEVTLDADPGPHIVGETVPALARAAYYSGGGLPEARIDWRAVSRPGHFTPPGWQGWAFGRGGWWAPAGRVNQQTVSGTTDAVGEHRVQLELVSADPPFPYALRLDAQVGDVNRQIGSAGVDLLVHPASRYAGLRTGRGWVHPGDSLSIEVVSVDLAGRAVPGSAVVMTAERVEWRWIMDRGQDQVVTDEVIPVCTVTTSSDPVRCVWRPEESGSYRLTAELRDEVGRASRTELVVWVAGDQLPISGERPEAAAVTMVPDREEYQPGDTARVLVASPIYPARALLTIRQSGVLRTETFELREATQEILVEISEQHIPNVVARVELVDEDWGARSASGELNLAVPPRRRELDVRLLPRDSVLLPGASSAIDLEVRGPDGRPVPGAEVALWMVDEAILGLGGYRLPDPLDAFYPVRYPYLRDLSSRPFVLLAPRSAGPGTVSGMVVSALTGERFAGARVTLEGTDITAVTGPGGTFTLTGVAPGSYVLRVEGAGHGVRRAIEVPAEGVHLGTLVTPTGAIEEQAEALAVGAAPPPPPPAVPAPRAQLQDGRAEAALDMAGMAVTGYAGDPVALREEFAPLALFEPSLRTGADGRVRVPVVLPQSLTRYRVMAVAVDGPARFGRGEGTVTARQELMVRPSAPRFLNFGDRVEIPVLVQNAADRDLTVDVAARASGLRLEAPRGQRVTVPRGERVEVRFPAIADGAGTARLQFVAVSGTLSDAASVSVPVYTPATTEAFATYGELDTPAAALLPVRLPGDLISGFGGLEITLSSTALQELTDAVLFLESYPFEGAEQIASRVLGVAALRDVLSAFRAEGLPPADSLEAAVRRDLSRLATLQRPDGGWSFWRPDRPADPYVTVHVTHSLQRAREIGYQLPAGVLERALEYLQRTLPDQVARYGPNARVGIQAYAVYVRARAGDPQAPLEASRLLERARAATPLDDLPLEAAAWLLHAIADVPTLRPVAQELLRTIHNRATETAATATFVTSYGGDDHLLLHSGPRSDAVVLEALMAADPNSDLVVKAARGLLAHRTRGRWLSTQENAWALLALQRYFRTYEGVVPDLRAGVWLGDRYAGGRTFQGRTTERHHIAIPLAHVRAVDTATDLTLSRSGQGRLYYRAALRYAPADLDLPALQRGFVVERSYEAVNDPNAVRRDQFGNWRIRLGALVRVRLVMTAPSRRHHVALVDPLPAAFEPLNPELHGTGFVAEPIPPPAPGPRALPDRMGPAPTWLPQWFSHQNLRDDRAEAFADMVGAGRYEYTYIARATSPGTFVVPPARAEEMYNPESFGRTGTERVIVE